jgi:hypothetical protein
MIRGLIGLAIVAVAASTGAAGLVPVAGFLIFQRSFLRGNGLGGAIKG